jgi:hypothetical protein
VDPEEVEDVIGDYEGSPEQETIITTIKAAVTERIWAEFPTCIKMTWPIGAK